MCGTVACVGERAGKTVLECDYVRKFPFCNVFLSKNAKIVDNFCISSDFISVDLFNFVNTYTMVWTVVWRILELKS